MGCGSVRDCIHGGICILARAPCATGNPPQQPDTTYNILRVHYKSFLCAILAFFRNTFQLPILEKHSGSRVGSGFRHVVSIIHPEAGHSPSLCNSSDGYINSPYSQNILVSVRTSLRTSKLPFSAVETPSVHLGTRRIKTIAAGSDTHTYHPTYTQKVRPRLNR